MRPLNVFEHITLDGFICDPNGDMSWAHAGRDPELDAFASKSASGGGVLLFGRKTYEMMASFWPTAQAARAMPEVAKGMNASRKLVASRTLKSVAWANAELLQGDLVEAVRRVKGEDGPGMTILGSGSIAAQLGAAGLIDSYMLIVNPVVLGSGRSIFAGVTGRPELKLAESKTFKTGKVLLRYEVGGKR